METGMDYLSNHVVILGLPPNINEHKLCAAFNCKEKILLVRSMDDPTFPERKAALLKFQDPLAASTAAVRMTYMTLGSPTVVLNAGVYVKTCAEHLKTDECQDMHHRIIARGLRRDASESLYLQLFAKFGTIQQYEFQTLDSDYAMVVEYSCAVECLMAQLALSGRVMRDSTIVVQRVPDCRFQVPQVEGLCQYLAKLNTEVTEGDLPVTGSRSTLPNEKEFALNEERASTANPKRRDLSKPEKERNRGSDLLQTLHGSLSDADRNQVGNISKSKSVSSGSPVANLTQRVPDFSFLVPQVEGLCQYLARPITEVTGDLHASGSCGSLPNAIEFALNEERESTDNPKRKYILETEKECNGGTDPYQTPSWISSDTTQSMLQQVSNISHSNNVASGSHVANLSQRVPDFSFQVPQVEGCQYLTRPITEVTGSDLPAMGNGDSWLNAKEFALKEERASTDNPKRKYILKTEKECNGGTDSWLSSDTMKGMLQVSNISPSNNEPSSSQLANISQEGLIH